jgi:hypothetical protein
VASRVSLSFEKLAVNGRLGGLMMFQQDSRALSLINTKLSPDTGANPTNGTERDSRLSKQDWAKIRLFQEGVAINRRDFPTFMLRLAGQIVGWPELPTDIEVFFEKVNDLVKVTDCPILEGNLLRMLSYYSEDPDAKAWIAKRLGITPAPASETELVTGLLKKKLAPVLGDLHRATLNSSETPLIPKGIVTPGELVERFLLEPCPLTCFKAVIQQCNLQSIHLNQSWVSNDAEICTELFTLASLPSQGKAELANAVGSLLTGKDENLVVYVGTKDQRMLQLMLASAYIQARRYRDQIDSSAPAILAPSSAGQEHAYLADTVTVLEEPAVRGRLSFTADSLAKEYLDALSHIIQIRNQDPDPVNAFNTLLKAALNVPKIMAAMVSQHTESLLREYTTNFSKLIVLAVPKQESCGTIIQLREQISDALYRSR